MSKQSLDELIDDLVPVHRQDEFRAAIVEAVEGLIGPEKNLNQDMNIHLDNQYVGFNQCRNKVLQAIKEWQ